MTSSASGSASTKILSNNPSDDDDDEEVLIQRNGGSVFVTYNRPKALNALTLGMIRRLNSVLPSLQDDSAVSVLIQKGTGRAFCAGGDVKQVVEKARNEASIEDAGAFFREEYALDHLLATYRKPVVSLWNGFVMGGGVGVSIHAPFRVATGKTVMAMPETQIGLYPDVGGSFFLSTAGKLFDGHLGTYLGLTGARLKGEECYWSGAATHYVHDEEKLKLLEHDLSTLSLSHDSSNSFKIVNDILETYSSPVDAKNDPFALGTEKRRIIDECFKFNTVEDIIVALRRETQSPFAQETLKTLSRMSPIALKLTLEQIRRGSKLKSLKNAFRMENSMSYHSLLALVTEGKSKDFKEGVRALLVDKTNDPKWSPETLESISKEDLEWYFKGVPKTENDSLEVKFLSNMDYAQYPYNFGLPKERELTTIFKSLRRKSLDAFKQEVRKAAPYQALEKAGEQAKVEAFFQFVQTKGSKI
jgi:3-hydroxyisobutyryl-CoA hydrolase